MKLNRIYCDDTNESLSTTKTIKEQKADIEVENPGILEVPEGKNVEDLPIKHFVDIANRKGLSTVTRALNNLQVWNKNKNKSLSKWAGNMIDKVSKRFENQKNESFKRNVNENVDTKLEDIDYIMYNDLPEYNVEIITDNTFGEFEVEFNGAKATVKFDLSNDTTAYYVFYINGDGPYETDSSERVCMNIHDYLYDLADNLDEEILNEFSSNYADTEFDEMEFYSDTLRDVSANKIATAIETGCDFDINIYDVEIDTMGTMIISYEVREEDYNPDVIESTIISILERMEDRMRESFNRRNCNEDYNIDFDAITIPEDERYEYIKSKTVLDSDGWRTDYTMYYDWEDDKYIFIFGDNDLYDPTNESPDWECDTEAEANEWFDNYTGFDDEEDFDECCRESINRKFSRRTIKESDDDLVCVKYKGDKESLEALKDCALSLGDSVKDYISKGYLIICTDEYHLDELNDDAKELGLSKGTKVKESCKESVYTDAGFKNRKDYLKSLADDYGIDINTVYDLASMLGPDEDFDALVTELEDMTDDYTGEDNTTFLKELDYALKHYNYVVYDNASDEFDWWIGHFDDYKSAADNVITNLCRYNMDCVLCDTNKHLRTIYNADKLDASVLSTGKANMNYYDMSYFTDDVENFIVPYLVGEDTAIENIRDILDMCEVKTEKY